MEDKIDPGFFLYWDPIAIGYFYFIHPFPLFFKTIIFKNKAPQCDQILYVGIVRHCCSGHTATARIFADDSGIALNFLYPLN